MGDTLNEALRAERIVIELTRGHSVALLEEALEEHGVQASTTSRGIYCEICAIWLNHGGLAWRAVLVTSSQTCVVMHR